jgi:hypothetical protein
MALTEAIGFFESDVDGLALDDPRLGKFACAAHEFAVYMGSRHRTGLDSR